MRWPRPTQGCSAEEKKKNCTELTIFVEYEISYYVF